ncbi:MAG: hypothetical protein ABSH39_11630 [Candidatus Acidiferrum sp.]|jgi:hypothetical protein
MSLKFDIFKKLPDGHPLWVKAVAGLEEARVQMARLVEIAPAEYFVYCQSSGTVVQTAGPSRS